uniref:Uncharacterized protein n=1 Tax=Anguilla anguilla TaxID=7936 RepID=A0A0E9XN20_ANGAN
MVASGFTACLHSLYAE